MTALLNVKDVSKVLGIHPQSTIKILKSGKLRGAFVLGSWRIEESALVSYIESQSRGGQ